MIRQLTLVEAYRLLKVGIGNPLTALFSDVIQYLCGNIANNLTGFPSAEYVNENETRLLLN